MIFIFAKKAQLDKNLKQFFCSAWPNHWTGTCKGILNDLIVYIVALAVEKKRRLSQIEITKMALKKVESDSEEERVRA